MPDADLMRWNKIICSQDIPAVKSKTEDLSKIREAHEKEKAAGRYVWLLKPNLFSGLNRYTTALHDKQRLREWKLR